MNYREQRVLRDQANGAGRGDLADSLDKLNAELDELDGRTREASRTWRAASDEQDAKAAELRELGRQIRDLTSLPVITTHEGRTIGARNNIPATETTKEK
jgi:hypothetical protein